MFCSDWRNLFHQPIKAVFTSHPYRQRGSRLVLLSAAYAERLATKTKEEEMGRGEEQFRNSLDGSKCVPETKQGGRWKGAESREGCKSASGADDS